VGPYLALWRVRACAAGAAAVFLGAYLATGAARPIGLLAVAAAGIGLVIGFANAVNDIVDRSADAIDKPHRPLPSGRVSVRSATAFAVATALAALACSAPLGLWAGIWMAVLIAVSVAYSVALKGTVLVGNAFVAACAAVPLAYGAAVSGEATGTVWVGCALVFVFMFSYEVLKTAADLRGDAAAGVRTVATRWGSRGAGTVYTLAVAVLTGVAIWASRFSSHSGWYLASATATYLIPSWYAVSRLGSAVYGHLMLVLRRAWLFGLLTLWLLR
jgi:geranylgeranylglycerol-phosphate geranylgeranyltransferase